MFESFKKFTKAAVLAGGLAASTENASADSTKPQTPIVEKTNTDNNKTVKQEQLKNDLLNVKNPEKIIYSKNYSDQEKIFILSELGPQYQKLVTWYEIANRNDIPEEIRKSAGGNFSSHIAAYLVNVKNVETGTYVIPK